jgi:DNA integrity scanning protein DisA with diadenylate cyclase activity
VFVGGQPLLVRRREHWTAFPLELAAFVAGLIEGGRAAGIVAQAAYILSAQGRGAILAVVGGRDRLDGIVSPKDRYDLRNEFDWLSTRPETRLHHLIDAQDLDQQTLARLAALDGATIVDRDGNLLAYGAIVASSDSQHEGARTAAAKTLSHTADVAIVVSQDGDITVFRAGAAAVTLLGRRDDG